MRVREELGELFADAEFAEALGVRGRPGWSPGQLALVTVLQFAENLTDWAAAHRVHYGMDLKNKLGLELDDPGFDASVLSEFRTRLVEHGMEENVLDLSLTALKDRGLVRRAASSAPTPPVCCDDPDDRDSAAVGQATAPGGDGPPPRLITGIATSDATVTDAGMTEPVHHMLMQRAGLHGLPGNRRPRAKHGRLGPGDDLERGIGHGKTGSSGSAGRERVGWLGDSAAAARLFAVAKVVAVCGGGAPRPGS